MVLYKVGATWGPNYSQVIHTKHTGSNRTSTLVSHSSKDTTSRQIVFEQQHVCRAAVRKMRLFIFGAPQPTLGMGCKVDAQVEDMHVSPRDSPNLSGNSGDANKTLQF